MQLKDPQKRTYNPLRLHIFQAIVVLTFGLLAFRIYQLQFVLKDEFVNRADENRFSQVSEAASRGIITDRNGVELAINVPSANVTVTPALLPADEEEELEVLTRLSSLIGVPLEGELNTVDERGIPQQSLIDMVREGEGIAPFRPVTVKSDVGEDVARIILAEQGTLPGVDIEYVSVRDYPTGSLTSHVIGYTGPIPDRLADDFLAQGYVLDRDRIGYDGVEFSLDEWLGGSPGLQIVERDVAGEIIRTIGTAREAEPGYSVRLTIDVELQAAAEQHLRDTFDNLRTISPDNPIGFGRGVVIAMNPRTGEILAMVSLPAYDNQRFARNIDYAYYLQVSEDPDSPLLNQAVASLYPPGSVFKIVTATGILEEDIVDPFYLVNDPGQVVLQNRYYENDPGQAQTFVCWNREGHGDVNVIQAIAFSCNVFFYKVGGGYEDEVPGIGLGINRLGHWMEIFGFAQSTGVELAADQYIPNIAVIPTPDWKRRVWGENWSTGDTYNSAFGQGYVLATPLQIIGVDNVIANNGIFVQPTLVLEVLDADGRVVRGFEPETDDIRDRIREYRESVGETYVDTFDETLQYIQEGMRSAATLEGGTAVPAQEDYLPYVPIAAKTGTAEFCDDVAAQLGQCEFGNWPDHGWYMSYAPYGNPEIAVMAFVYNGGEGSAVALPVAASTMNDYFQLKTQRAIEQQIEDEQAARLEAERMTP